jgi:hypothetical protein
VGTRVHTCSSAAKAKEFSKLLLEADTSGGHSRGLQLFSKRRERADQWVIDNQKAGEVVG